MTITTTTGPSNETISS